MKKALRFVGFVALAVLVGATAAAAGSLGPSAAPANTMYTLADVYALVTTGTTTASSGFSTPGSVSASMYSLSQIVDAFASSTRNLSAANIADGVTIFGIEGTHSGGAATLEWQAAYPGVNHPKLCYNSSTLAPALASASCYDGGEGYGGGLINQNGNVLGALEYCQFLNADGETLANSAQNIWRLPTLAELTTEVYDNQGRANFDDYQIYWTTSQDTGNDGGSRDPGLSWYTFDFDGDYVYSSHIGYNLVRTRCVREI